ncbi:MAG: class I SAM-dependent methyltransferase [Bdellovibrionaceae bacterium]|nr:class I SAM-dependent methyltransferase [Pseudobdellovibrionaceae bacterium]
MSMDTTVKSKITQENVARYVVEKIVVESDLERRLRQETSRLPNAGMISSSDVGAFLALMARSIQARQALEIGTFTGYTALKVAAALPENGRLICCDINAEWTGMGRPYWQEARVDKKIDLRLSPALETLQGLLQEGQAGAFDFAFIDADKRGYNDYYEACLQLLRPGGLIILDNMLWDGAVADPEAQDGTTNALRAMNEKISRDPRVDACLLTVGDGLMLARKK